jgi:tetraacyldisaccharide 4'-kinase
VYSPVNADSGLARLWYGDDLAARSARLLLSPASLLYAVGTRVRNALYDRGVLRSRGAGVPTISVGNLSVGGTGKTPFTAFLAGRLLASGARPVIVMRGYGADEVEVHRILNPAVPVVVAADRVRGAQEAVARHGAGVILLDDGFQHRRLRRELDVVLVAADAGVTRLTLPAGPLRESADSLARASLIVITRKAADAQRVTAVRRMLTERAPAVPAAVAWIRPQSLRSWEGQEQALSALAGRRVLLISGIADPEALRRQVAQQDALVDSAVHADHHAYTSAEVDSLVRRASTCEIALCTLKDAVKLGPLWPRAAVPLWYVSQTVEMEEGAPALDRALASVTGTITR